MLNLQFSSFPSFLIRMSVLYNYYLVFLSVLVAIQAGYVGLNLAKRIPGSFAIHRRALIAGSAMTLAVGIWSMHFVGMLAIITSVTIEFLSLPTLGSFLICVLVTGIAVFLASLRSRNMLVFAAVFMGSGITTMHYVGMTALSASVGMQHNHAWVLASVLLAISASGLALRLAFLADTRLPTLVGAVVFGLAVSGMHYTAMAGTTLQYSGDHIESASTLSRDNLAMIISIVAFSISALFMLMLIPKQRRGREETQDWTGPIELEAVKPAKLHQIAEKESAILETDATVYEAPLHFPIEKNGNRFQIEASEIFSVHANAHYTYIFNGKEDLFCPMSISELDEKLVSANFFRTHRSYIVNLNNIMTVRKSGDAAVAELDCAIRRTVPVGRARVSEFRDEWGKFQISNAS